jgi:hypothetical protein
MGRHGIIMLLTIALLVPVVICVIPGTAIAAESDCCDHMSADCGDQSSMSECCSITISDLLMIQPAGKIADLGVHPPDAITFPPEVLPIFDSACLQTAFQNDSSGSPPTSSPGFNAVLRI